jgi:DNA-directed RNA polymerase specialized sigma24 family protein
MSLEHRLLSLEHRLLSRHAPGNLDGLPEPAIELRRAIVDLPRRQRTAIVLTYFADLVQEDVAVAMGIKRGTVASTLSDARTSLAIQFKEAT